MVAIIKFGTSIKSTFLYNENKVKEGVAECLQAQNYPMDLEQMQEIHRLNMLLKLAERHKDAKQKSTHITLNFAPEESYSKEKLLQIANDYMEGIGFGEQPFLIYQHHDAGHMHLHIVTTKIQSDGTLIDTNYIGKRVSEPVRKSLEEKYKLVRAEDHKASVFRLQPVNLSKAQYGKQVTKRAIYNILVNILDVYKYTSLAELNAVLNLYNVSAERGSEASRTFKSGGLVYRVLGADGKPISAPIKASDFFMKPTLKFLESKYLKNDLERQKDKQKLKSSIDFTLKTKQIKSIDQLTDILYQQGIRMVQRINEDGILYGLTYVDLKNKTVFNGSALGKEYSAKSIQERFSVADAAIRQSEKVSDHNINTANVGANDAKAKQQKEPVNSIKVLVHNHDSNSLEQLMQSEDNPEYLPFELKRSRKKRKKRKTNNL